jgi:hypothetical protein
MLPLASPTLISRHELIALARTLVAQQVRWKHQGKRPDTGVDCAGALVYLAAELGLFEVPPQAYRREADGVTLARACLQVMDPLPSLAAVCPGDVLSFDDHGKYPCHLALAADGAEPFSLIHATPLHRKVVEQRFDEGYWRLTFRQAYTWQPCYPSGRGVAPWPF